MKKRKVLLIIATFLLICSITMYTYPLISKTVVNFNCNTITKDYDISVSNIMQGNSTDAYNNNLVDSEGYLIDKVGNRQSSFPVLFQEDLDRLYRDSVEYNTKLNERQDISNSTYFEYSALDLNDYGIHNGLYGYITAPTISLKLPIYLGSTDYNMRYGAVHLMNTSLPVGGENSNTVIAGHTGYIGKVFFDNIKKLSKGDAVSITNYFETLNYEVIEIKTVESTYTDDIYIKKGKDTLTMITCANGGHNRLIVTCERECENG